MVHDTYLDMGISSIALFNSYNNKYHTFFFFFTKYQILILQNYHRDKYWYIHKILTQ